jgi:uncharacterized protein
MPAKRIIVTGGTGFVGRSLIRALVARGDSVTVLSRNPAAHASGPRALPTEARVAQYTPLAEGPWCKELISADAVVHLAGAQVVGVRWTKGKRRELESSRIGSTKVLVSAISSMNAGSRPRVLVGASAVGYYGPRDASDVVDESSNPGTDYLATLVVRWEAEQARAVDLGVRVVHMRLAIVLGEAGGALDKMLLPFKLHVGGPIGTGAQMVPWIHADDACGLIMFAIDNPEAKGPINAVAPHQVTMNELAEAIGNVLDRSSSLRVPGAVLRALYGEGAGPLLTGQRVAPSVAFALGYEFRFTEIRKALANVLGRS